MSFFVTANIIVGILELIFTIYLASIYSNSSLAIISLIFTFNYIFLSLNTDGFMITISKIVTVLFATDKDKIKKSMPYAFASNFIWSIGLSIIIIMIFSLLKYFNVINSTFYICILLLCPCLIINSFTSIFKGYFIGLQKIVIPSIIDFIEKSLRIICLLCFIASIQNAISNQIIQLVVFSYFVSEIISVIFFGVYYKSISKKLKNQHIEIDKLSVDKKLQTNNNLRTKTKKLQPNNICILSKISSYKNYSYNFTTVSKKLFKESLPICFSNCMIEISNLCAFLIVAYQLVNSGLNDIDALNSIGTFKAITYSLTSCPIIIITSIALLIVPKISLKFLQKDKPYINNIIKKICVTAFSLGVLNCLIFLAFGEQIGNLLYERNNLHLLLFTTSLITPFMFTAVMTNNILIGLSKQDRVFYHTLIYHCIMLLLLFITTPLFNINSFVFSMSFGYFVLILLNWKVIIKTYHKI